MRTRYVLFVLVLLSYCFGSAKATQGQQSTSDNGRRIVQKTAPRYPELAKKLNLSGIVKVVAVVTSDGKVRKVEPMGGSPILVQAAQDAISQWKFAPGAESRETVELHFTP
jgi:TonB family protein